jgi:23S rRNA G2445 N2-methylase RlmL
MSSTNRSKAREQHVSDYYITPVQDIETFLQQVYRDRCVDLFHANYKFLDPCAGGDKAHPMSYPTALQNIGFKGQIDTIDVREDSPAKMHGDYLHFKPKQKYDVIITNPPFNLAIAIIEKALQDVMDKGYVIMLLRLNFLALSAEKNFLKKICLYIVMFIARD